MSVTNAKIKKIAVLTSGGDAPGMNAAVRAVVRKALHEGVEVVGSMGGYRGLIDDDFVELTASAVANIESVSGTFIYTDRCLDFKTEEGMQKAIAAFPPSACPAQLTTTLPPPITPSALIRP